MKRHLLIAAAGVLLASVPAYAVKLLVRMEPQNLASEGFKISTKQEEGVVRFQVTRDLSKARWEDRLADLTISGEGGTVARCAVEGRSWGT